MAWIRKQWFAECVLHIPNERKCSPIQGAYLKALGVQRGVSDLFIAVPVSGFGGYWIELKAPGKKPDEYQLRWLETMAEAGYQTGWFDNWEIAKKKIEQYFSLLI